MKAISLLFWILILNLTVFSQSGTMQFTGGASSDKAAVLLIPFEPFMYISEIDKQLIKESKLSAKEMKSEFAKALDFHLYQSFNERYSVLSFYFMDDEIEQDLTHIFRSRKLNFEALPSEEKNNLQDNSAALKGKFKNSFKKEEADYGGQIVTKQVTEERFMNAEITNTNLLDSLYMKHQAKLYLFINQLEFRNIYGDYTTMQTGEYNRQAKVHYTLFTKEGVVIAKGISTADFPSRENKIDEITTNYFPILADGIYEQINILTTPKTN
tara:strand:- start:957 stop:1763 length:807 start_codon:yes stop_codon:yes gene_type:complete